MAEKCFCHLNGYKVKDADARAHMENKQNPHNVTAAQVGALPAVESAEYPGCFYVQDGERIKWVNPPFVRGTEYLTTEFYDEKEIYAMNVGTGDLPKNGTKSVDCSSLTSGIDGVISVTGCTTQGHSVPYDDGNLKINVSMLGTIISVTTNQEIPNFPKAYLIIKYYKAE